MQFTTYAERQGLEKGLAKGRREGFLKAARLGLKLKFGDEGLGLLLEIEKVEDLAALEAICDAIEPAVSLDDVRKLIPPSEQSPPA